MATQLDLYKLLLDKEPENSEPANAFEAKRQARIERLQAAASRAEAEGDATYKQAKQMADVIPLGQPILVGHHSEKADRNYRARISNKWDKAHDLYDKAEALRARAEAAAKNKTIFSDDPNAAEKIEDKIARLEKRQEIMKAANKLVRKQDRDGLLEMGFSDTTIDKLFTPDFCGRLGFPDYEITNNGANIRRLKQRLTTVKANAEREYSETEINGIRIVDDPDENRTQVYFPGKPAPTVISELKAHGFHWTPSLKCWQRYMSNGAHYYAEQIAKQATE